MPTSGFSPLWENDYCEWNDYIRCPYCGDKTEGAEMWEMLPRTMHLDGDAAEATCDKCEKDFRVKLCVLYEFQTLPMEPEQSE